MLDTTCPRLDAFPLDAIDAVDFVDCSQGVQELRICEPVEWSDTSGGEDEKYPAWVCAFLLVAYCSVFWAGVITVGQWTWNGISSFLF